MKKENPYFPPKGERKKLTTSEKISHMCECVCVCVWSEGKGGTGTVEPAVYWLALVLWLYSVEQMGRRWISTYPLSSIPPPTKGPSLNNQPRTCFHFPSYFSFFFLFQFLLVSFFFSICKIFPSYLLFYRVSIDKRIEKKWKTMMLEC